jgi:hypothetical protein
MFFLIQISMSSDSYLACYNHSRVCCSLPSLKFVPNRQKLIFLVFLDVPGVQWCSLSHAAPGHHCTRALCLEDGANPLLTFGAPELNLNSINSIQTTHKSTMEQRQEQDYGGSVFPTNPEEFDADERISFSKLDNKFVLVQEDGSEFEFDDAIKRWIPVVDEALLEEQQKAYRVSGVDEAEPVEAMKRKRKKEYVNGEDVCPQMLFIFNANT